MQSKLSSMTFAAVDKPCPGGSSPPSIEEQSVQCSPYQMAAQRMRSPVLRSHMLLASQLVQFGRRGSTGSCRAK